MRVSREGTSESAQRPQLIVWPQASKQLVLQCAFDLNCVSWENLIHLPWQAEVRVGSLKGDKLTKFQARQWKKGEISNVQSSRA